MRVRGALAAAIALTLACGELGLADPDPAEFAQLCGAAGPVRILQFEPWRWVGSAQHLGVFGDRRMIAIYYEDTAVARSALWSVGLCGESPRQLLSGEFFSVRTHPLDDEQPLVCDGSTGEFWVVDPSGERAPKLLFTLPDRTCSFTLTDAGAITFDAEPPDSETEASTEPGALVLLRWPDDLWNAAVTPELLLDDVEPVAYANYNAFTVDGTDVFGVNANAELVRLALGDSSVEVIATGVRSFWLSWEPIADEQWSRRYLVWQRAELTNSDPEAPEGEIVLLDRETGEQTSVGPGWLGASGKSPLSWSYAGLLHVFVRVDDELVPRLYSLEDFSHIDLPTTIELQDLLIDDRRMFAEVIADEAPALFDVETGEWERLPGNPGVVYRWPERELALLPSAGRNRPLADSELWLLGQGEQPRLVARRATRQHAFMPDGRILSSVGLDSEGIGDLLVIDPATLEERLVASDIVSYTVQPPQPNTGESIVYAVVEPERAGVWITQLEPRE